MHFFKDGQHVFRKKDNHYDNSFDYVLAVISSATNIVFRPFCTNGGFGDDSVVVPLPSQCTVDSIDWVPL